MPVTKTKASAPAKAAPKAKSKKGTITNEVTIDPKRPVPFESGTAFSYINHTYYIPFLPPLDNFSQQLLEARLLSTTHNACITTKKDYCAGNGFQNDNGTDLDPAFVEWLSSMNLKNEPVTEINKQAFESFFTFGNVPIEVVRLTVAGKKHLFVYVHNFQEWRLVKPGDDDIVTHAIQSKLFVREGYITVDDLKKARKLPIYNPRRREKDNWFKDEKGVERTLIWYKHSVSGYSHYGLPSAVSSMIFQLLEYKGARFNLDNFENNMIISAILALKGNLTQEEANKIGRQAIQTHTGDGKRGRVMVVASEEGIEGSDFHSFDTHKEGSYNEADDKWTQKIILANQWDSVLAGIVSSSTLGKGSGFITKILEHILRSVIKPAQNDIEQKVWKHIFTIANEWLGFSIKPEEISIKNDIDISGLTDVDITPAVTRNEVRIAKGLPEDPSEKGKEYMKSTGPEVKQKGGEDVQD
jgi:hypothetical protein